MRLFNVIKVTGRLLYNAITRHNRYVLKFNRENDGVWYIDFPGWPFKHHNLAMVGGADKLCTYLVGCPVQCSEKLRLKSPVKLLIQHSDF